jgi:hypothetical protein
MTATALGAALHRYRCALLKRLPQLGGVRLALLYEMHCQAPARRTPTPRSRVVRVNEAVEHQSVSARAPSLRRLGKTRSLNVALDGGTKAFMSAERGWIVEPPPPRQEWHLPAWVKPSGRHFLSHRQRARRPRQEAWPGLEVSRDSEVTVAPSTVGDCR